jgi:ligand-binding SRPBCC domain-containing protein
VRYDRPPDPEAVLRAVSLQPVDLNMRYTHRFLVQAPLEDVIAFHRSASSLQAITPPLFFMGGLKAPGQLIEGSQMSFRLWLGPLPVDWKARIENLTPAGFDDVQISGPFASWVHSHSFHSLSTGICQVEDKVELHLRLHPLWFPVGLAMVLGLPLLFAFRSRKTKSMLERSNK